MISLLFLLTENLLPEISLDLRLRSLQIFYVSSSMSSDSSYSESNLDSDDSEVNYYSEYEIEAEPDSEDDIALADDESPIPF